MDIEQKLEDIYQLANDIKGNMENDALKSEKVNRDALEAQVARLEALLDAMENDAAKEDSRYEQECFDQVVKLVNDRLYKNEAQINELCDTMKEIESLSDMVKELPERVNGQESQTLRFLTRANQELEHVINEDANQRREWGEKAVALNNQMRTLQQACDVIQQSIETMGTCMQTSTKQLDLLMGRLGICEEGSEADGL